MTQKTREEQLQDDADERLNNRIEWLCKPHRTVDKRFTIKLDPESAEIIITSTDGSEIVCAVSELRGLLNLITNFDTNLYLTTLTE